MVAHRSWLAREDQALFLERNHPQRICRVTHSASGSSPPISLPFSQEELYEWLRSKHSDVADVVGIETAALQGGQSSWELTEVRATCRDHQGNHHEVSLILKARDYMPEWFGRFRHYYTEVLTWHLLLEDGSLPLPQLYASHHEEGPARRWLLMEFLHGRDSARGELSPDEYLQAAGLLARFHGHYWERSGPLSARAPWLYSWSYADEMESYEEILACMLWAKHVPGWQEFRDRWDPRMRELMPHVSKLLQEMHACPHALCHGDPCGSFIVRDTATGPSQIAFFDLEKAQIGPACHDFTLFRPQAVHRMCPASADPDMPSKALAVYRTTLRETCGVSVPSAELRRWVALAEYSFGARPIARHLSLKLGLWSSSFGGEEAIGAYVEEIELLLTQYTERVRRILSALERTEWQ